MNEIETELRRICTGWEQDTKLATSSDVRLALSTWNELNTIRVLVTVFDSLPDPEAPERENTEISIAFFNEHDEFMFDQLDGISMYRRALNDLRDVVSEERFIEVYGALNEWNGSTTVKSAESARTEPRFWYRRSWRGTYDAQAAASTADAEVTMSLMNILFGL